MQKLDVLGSRPDRGLGFCSEMLSEAHDEVLDRIVQEAAAELEAPIALVSLILDQVQYFKAHHGLPPDLAAARSTHRDVSFCQIVVRDDAVLEVRDASLDQRVPQQLVLEYGIRAYLGHPLRVGDVVVGSLCVLDTESRCFTDLDRNTLDVLATRVSQRLASFSAERRRLRLELAEEVSHSAIGEMKRSLLPVFEGVSDALMAVPALRGVLEQYRHVALEGHSLAPEVIATTLESSARALAAIEASLHDLDASSTDCSDTLVGLELLCTPGPITGLSDLLFAAQDLSRSATRQAGGLFLAGVPEALRIGMPRSVAVTLLATTLMRVGSAAAGHGERDGLKISWAVHKGSLELRITATRVPSRVLQQIASLVPAGLSLQGKGIVRAEGRVLVLRLPLMVEPDALAVAN